MSDIAKCEGIDCPLKETCARYTVVADKVMQTWLTPIDYLDGSCEDYWKEVNIDPVIF